jgi:VanZ family protein
MLILAVYGNLIPFHYQPRPFSDAFVVFREMPYIDAANLGARGDWVVSVALFAFLGFLMMGAFCVDRPRWIGWVAAFGVCLFCSALSVLIEFTQIFFPPRTVSVNDIVVESVGGLVGTAIWLIAGQRMTRHIRKLVAEPNLSGLAARVLPCYLVLLLTIELMPFDFVVNTNELKTKYDEGRIWLIPFHYWPPGAIPGALGKVFITILCFFPAGFLRALSSKWHAPVGFDWRSALVFGLSITSVIELLKLLVFSRFCDTTIIFTGTVAVAGGWLTARVFQESWRASSLATESSSDFWNRRPWLAVLFVIWLAAVSYYNWRPFDFTTMPSSFADDMEDLPQHGMRRFSWLPVVEYYWSNKYEVLDQFFKKTFAFVPLGVLTSLFLHRRYRPGSAWPAVLAALAVGVALHVGRYFLPTRVPSVTDILLGCFGAWLGFRFLQHLRAILWAERTLFSYLRT